MYFKSHLQPKNDLIVQHCALQGRNTPLCQCIRLRQVRPQSRGCSRAQHSETDRTNKKHSHSKLSRQRKGKKCSQTKVKIVVHFALGPIFGKTVVLMRPHCAQCSQVGNALSSFGRISNIVLISISSSFIHNKCGSKT